MTVSLVLATALLAALFLIVVLQRCNEDLQSDVRGLHRDLSNEQAAHAHTSRLLAAVEDELTGPSVVISGGVTRIRGARLQAGPTIATEARP